MSPKKKNRAGPAQQLIEALLDERTPVKDSSPQSFSPSSTQKNQSRPLAKNDEPIPDISLSIDDRPFDARSRSPGTRPQPDIVQDPVEKPREVNPQQANLELEMTRTPLPSFANDAMASSPQETQPAPRAASQLTKKSQSSPSAKTEPRTFRSVSLSLEPKPKPEHKPEPDRQSQAQQESSSHEFEQTVRLEKADILERSEKFEATATRANATDSRTSQPDNSVVDRYGITELKTVVKMRDSAAAPRAAKSSSSSNAFNSADAQLKQSESLRLAQSRITELEIEIERLRRENENLASAGEILGRRTDELVAKTESLESQAKESVRMNDEERKVLRGQLQQKERENSELRDRLEQMEGRLENNFKNIRKNERDLVHRLEMARIESSTLVSAKDKMILDLKRQNDQLAHENEYFKQKMRELNDQFKGKEEKARVVVRALRIAMTQLEGEDGSGNGSGQNND